MLTEGAAGAPTLSPSGPSAPLAASPSATRSVPTATAQKVEDPAPAPAAERRHLSPAEEAQAGRNPFRGAQQLGKHSLEVAVEMFKSLGSTGGEAPRETPPARAPEASKPSSAPRGDLFDQQEEADLEIPSFLRKRKTG